MAKRNPTDLTLRNLRAHAKRIAALERETKALRIQLNRRSNWDYRTGRVLKP